MAWGLGRVAGLELPERWGGLIDVPAGPDGRAAGWLGGVLAGCGEDQVAIRDVGVLGRRLVRAAAPQAGPAWVPCGTVLVTGGTGSLGAPASWWVACRGPARGGAGRPGGAGVCPAGARGGWWRPAGPGPPRREWRSWRPSWPAPAPRSSWPDA